METKRIRRGRVIALKLRNQNQPIKTTTIRIRKTKQQKAKTMNQINH